MWRKPIEDWIAVTLVVVAAALGALIAVRCDQAVVADVERREAAREAGALGP